MSIFEKGDETLFGVTVFVYLFREFSLGFLHYNLIQKKPLMTSIEFYFWDKLLHGDFVFVLPICFISIVLQQCF